MFENYNTILRDWNRQQEVYAHLYIGTMASDLEVAGIAISRQGLADIKTSWQAHLKIQNQNIYLTIKDVSSLITLPDGLDKTYLQDFTMMSHGSQANPTFNSTSLQVSYRKPAKPRIMVEHRYDTSTRRSYYEYTVGATDSLTQKIVVRSYTNMADFAAEYMAHIAEVRKCLAKKPGWLEKAKQLCERNNKDNPKPLTTNANTNT